MAVASRAVEKRLLSFTVAGCDEGPKAGRGLDDGGLGGKHRARQFGISDRTGLFGSNKLSLVCEFSKSN